MHEASLKAKKVKKKLADERKLVNELTRLLCFACGKLEAEGLQMDKDLSLWWEAHLEKERKRLAAEAKLAAEKKKKRDAKVKREKKKKNALNKLTDEERELFGFVKRIYYT